MDILNFFFAFYSNDKNTTHRTWKSPTSNNMADNWSTWGRERKFHEWYISATYRSVSLWYVNLHRDEVYIYRYMLGKKSTPLAWTERNETVIEHDFTLFQMEVTTCSQIQRYWVKIVRRKISSSPVTSQSHCGTGGKWSLDFVSKKADWTDFVYSIENKNILLIVTFLKIYQSLLC